MYSFWSRVRYSEVNSKKELTLSSLLNYLQDCCTFQSEDMDVGVEYLHANHFAWVLSSWEVVINSRPKLAEQIEVGTWPYDFKGFYGYRNFTVKDKAGEIKAFANSVWVFMDTSAMRPVRIAEGMVKAYLPEISTGIDYQWSDRKIRVFGKGENREPVRVQKFHIDTNCHMNNEKYVLLAEEYLSEDFVTGRIRAEYRKAAMLGDLLHPVVYTAEDEVSVVLSDEDGAIYAVVQFIRSKD